MVTLGGRKRHHATLAGLLLGAAGWFGCGDDESAGAGGSSSEPVGGGGAIAGGGGATTGGSGGVAGEAGGGGTGGGAVDPCASIAPSSDAAQNYATLQGCLDQVGHAYLAAGEFPVVQGIRVPINATLGAVGADQPTLRLAASSTNYLVSVATGASVDGLTLDANHLLPPHLNEAVVHVEGDQAWVSNNKIMNPSIPPLGHGGTGIYFICNTCSGAEASGNEILNTFYGAIFAGGLDSSHVNTLRNNQIHDIKCDSVTIAGYGRVEGNTIYNTGWDCENGPIPGGGIYCLDGPGGELVGNTIHDQCGMNIDIDGCTNLTITNNTLMRPGYDFGGSAPWCVGAQGMGLIDVSNATIEGNTVTNTDRASNRMGLSGDPNNVFRPSGGAAYADLPAGGNTAIAFTLTQRPNTGFKTTGTSLVGNTFIANCPSPCLGVGFFASRGTGFGAGGVWSASSTNYFTRNNVNGSQYGSKRCGGNWYAANATCDGLGSDDPSCNNDDYQHNPPGGDWARNDNCALY